MKSNAPKNYICPICLGIQGIENEHTFIKKHDLIYSDDLVSVFINSFYPKNTPAHVIVVPNKHYENIYELPKKHVSRVFEIAKEMAILLKKAYKADGIKIIQNNEPAADQHAFHFHLHVIPRFNNTEYPDEKRLAPEEERLKYAKMIKNCENSSTSSDM